MIIKRLRLQKDWSQEQLAQCSGLSLRTIQRIESSGTASNESMKSLAAVFELTTKELAQEFMLVDKSSKQWQQNPWWIKAIFWGSNKLWLRSRKEAVWFELFILLIASAFFIISFIQPVSDRLFLQSLSLMCMTCAYIWSKLIYLSDKYHIWQSGK